MIADGVGDSASIAYQMKELKKMQVVIMMLLELLVAVFYDR